MVQIVGKSVPTEPRRAGASNRMGSLYDHFLGQQSQLCRALELPDGTATDAEATVSGVVFEKFVAVA